jgi:hypothetical protein
MASVEPRCKRILEATNAGHYFADCECGWSGGVHFGRIQASKAWEAHRSGLTPIPPVMPVVRFGGPAQGMDE